MGDQYVALDQEARQSRISGKVVFLSVLISLSCVALWASVKVNEPVGAIDDATSLAVQPMKQVMKQAMQPARYVLPTQRTQSRNFMQPRAAFNEVQEATTGPDPSRRSILGGLAVLPMVAIADQAKAADKLKVDDFVPYFSYEGDLAVKGKVNSEGLTAGQKLSWDLAGMDPKCEGGPGDKPNSCGVHIHKGQSCKEDALGHYYATPEDPWKTITYTSKNGKASGKNVEVTTDLTNADVMGRTFIVHNFEGARVACGILK
jgi:hypothetical protein